MPSHSRWCPLLCYTDWKGPGKLLFFLNRKTVQARNYSISISGGSRRYTYVVSSCSSKTRIPSSTYVFLVSENCRQRKGQWQQAYILFKCRHFELVTYNDRKIVINITRLDIKVVFASSCIPGRRIQKFILVTKSF